MKGRVVVSVVALLVAGCAPSQPPAPPRPSPTPSDTVTPSLIPTEEREPTLPLLHEITGSLLEGDNAADVISELERVADDKPVLKLDLTANEATVVVLDDGKAAAYRWADDVIDETTTDFQYFDQQTFDPDSFPLDSIGRMFDIADLLEVRGELVYQIQQYRQDEVLQTVSSRPETTTVFFREDASAVPKLGVTSAADIRLGLKDVAGDAAEIHQFGFDPEKGFWAELTDEGKPISRKRTGGIPTFEAPSTPDEGLTPFDPGLVDPAVVAQTITRLSPDGSPCGVVVERTENDELPTMEFTCDGVGHHTDIRGRELDGEES